jgi:hypothetical protein
MAPPVRSCARARTLSDAAALAAARGTDVEYEMRVDAGSVSDSLILTDVGEDGRSRPGEDGGGGGARGFALPPHAGDLLVSVRVSRPCAVWAAVDRGFKRPRMPDRRLGALGPDQGDVTLLLPLSAVCHDRIVFVDDRQDSQDAGDDALAVTAVVRLHADRECRSSSASARGLGLLGKSFEARGGFLFPAEWQPQWFHGLGSDFA